MLISTLTSASSLPLLETVLVRGGLEAFTISLLEEDFRGDDMLFFVISVTLTLDSVFLFSLSIDFFSEDTVGLGVVAIPSALLLISFLSRRPFKIEGFKLVL